MGGESAIVVFLFVCRCLPPQDGCNRTAVRDHGVIDRLPVRILHLKSPSTICPPLASAKDDQPEPQPFLLPEKHRNSFGMNPPATQTFAPLTVLVLAADRQQG